MTNEEKIRRFGYILDQDTNIWNHKMEGWYPSGNTEEVLAFIVSQEETAEAARFEAQLARYKATPKYINQSYGTTV